MPQVTQPVWMEIKSGVQADSVLSATMDTQTFSWLSQEDKGKKPRKAGLQVRVGRARKPEILTHETGYPAMPQSPLAPATGRSPGPSLTAGICYHGVTAGDALTNRNQMLRLRGLGH